MRIPMKSISAVKFQREFGRFRTLAHRQPLTITNHSRADDVLISHEQYLAYQRYEQCAPAALFADEIPKETVDQFGSVPLSPEGVSTTTRLMLRNDRDKRFAANR